MTAIANPEKSAGQRNGRPTIGFALTGTSDPWHVTEWLGAVDAARDRNANLILFPGGAPVAGLAPPPLPQSSALYDLIDGEQIDGLLAEARTGVEGQIGHRGMRDASTSPGVIVRMGGDRPDVDVDVYHCMRQVLAHLVEVHGHRRIALACNAESDAAHQLLYRAYVDGLGEYDLPVDPRLCCGNPAEIAGWLQKINLSELDAVAGSDLEVLKVMRTLQALGVQVPEQVAIAGVDDVADAAVATPSLTTARVPFYELARVGIERVLALLASREVPEKEILAGKLVVRESCGCQLPEVTEAAAGAAGKTGNAFGAVPAVEPAGDLGGLARALGTSAESLRPAWIELLLESFTSELRDASSPPSGVFLRTLDRILRQAAAAWTDLAVNPFFRSGRASRSSAEGITVWQDVLSTLRRHVLPRLDDAQRALAEDLWQQARVMVGERARRVQAFHSLQAARQVHILREIEGLLTTTFDIARLLDVLADELPRLGIPGCYLALYEAPQPYAYPLPVPAWSRLVLAYDERGRARLPGDGLPFLSRQLAPPGMLPHDRQYVVMLEPLYFQENQLGFVLFEVGPLDGTVYDVLRRAISSALQGALLVQQVQEHAAELARQKYILDAFMDNVPDSIYFKDLEGRITQANAAYARRVGLDTPAEAIGKQDADLMPEEQARLRGQQEQAVVQTGEPLLRVEEHERWPDGREEWALSTRMPLRDEAGNVIGTFGISRDVTPLKQVQAALEEAYVEAERGRQLAEDANRLKSRFLSMVSHELHIPLSLIVGLCEMLILDGEQAPPQQVRQDIERILASAQHLDRLISDVLDLARSDAGQLRLACEPLDVGQVLRAAARIGEQLAREKGLAWRCEIPGDLPAVWGDRGRLSQVVLNLLANACKFTARGEVALAATTDGEQVTVTVTDTGIGVPPEEQDAIFDEFRQSERTTVRGYGGMGLGLAICKRLLEMHGGQIGVSSSGEEECGSAFSFTLPAMAQAPAGRAPEPAPEGRERIVLLTGQAERGEQLHAHLERRGFDVEVLAVEATPGRMSRLSSAPPGAVVVDMDVVAERGWEALQNLKRDLANRDVPMLFYSLAPDQDSGAVLDLDYLAKPVGTAELAQALALHGFRIGESQKERTLVVVDDEPGVLEMHARIVERHLPDCRVLRARNGKEALESIRRSKPDLVLLDLMMPEMDGFSVLEEMQGEKALRDVPVIVLTGQVLTEEDVQQLSRGVAMVLRKGLFSVEETLAQVEAVLTRKRRLSREMTVRKAMTYLHQHYAEPITRQEVAAHSCVSEGHLDRCFREEIGVPPMTYLKRHRVDQAKAMLAEGRAKIGDVAVAVGFPDGNYFGRVFRHEVGLSPTAYRQARKRQEE